MEVNLEPTVDQLTGVIGLLARENDMLRERVALAHISFFHRQFSSDDLLIGRSLVSKISSSPAGSLVVHLES